MYAVTLTTFAAAKLERIERIVQKHGGGVIDHVQRVALLRQVLAGQPQVIARYHEESCAANVVAELAVWQAAATVAKQAAGG